MNQLSTPDQQFMDMIRGHLKYIKPGEELDLDRQLKPLGLDSMAAVDLLLDIEDTYGITLSDKYLTDKTFATAHALWTVIVQLQQESSEEIGRAKV